LQNIIDKIIKHVGLLGYSYIMSLTTACEGMLYIICVLMRYKAERLSSVYVRLTNTDPVSVTPAPGSGNNCAYHSGTLSQTTLLTCRNEQACGRFLVVQLSGSNFLTLCEVQVFAKCSGIYCKQSIL